MSAKTRLFAVLLLENRHEIALYRSASQFIFFERCLQSRTTLLSSAMAMVSNSCTAPRGIEHYGNWVCRPTTSLRERCEHTHGWRNVSKQCRSARPVRHKSYVAEKRAVQYQHNQKPTTSSVLQNDGPPCRAIQSPYLQTSTLFVSYCISDSACSKSYKAKGSTCVSIFDQWLLWSGSRPAVIVQT